jgi:hypothetical protein
MADLTEKDQSLTIKIVGSDSNGVESNNFLQVDSLGRIAVSSGDTSRFFACAPSITPANNASDIFTISGVVDRTVEVTHIRITGQRTTGAVTLFQLIKRTSLNSGASTIITSIPAAGTVNALAVVRSYSNNPTLGTTQGVIRADRIYVPTVTTGTGGTFHDPFIWEFLQSPITLSTSNEVLAVNLANTSMAGGLLAVSVDWREV